MTDKTRRKIYALFGVFQYLQLNCGLMYCSKVEHEMICFQYRLNKMAFSNSNLQIKAQIFILSFIKNAERFPKISNL